MIFPESKIMHQFIDGSPEQMEDKHWTFWTMPMFLELCAEMKLKVIYANEYDDKVGNGFACIIKV